jgi:hypothetical protein
MMFGVNSRSYRGTRLPGEHFDSLPIGSPHFHLERLAVKFDNAIIRCSRQRRSRAVCANSWIIRSLVLVEWKDRRKVSILFFAVWAKEGLQI